MTGVNVKSFYQYIIFFVHHWGRIVAGCVVCDITCKLCSAILQHCRTEHGYRHYKLHLGENVFDLFSFTFHRIPQNWAQHEQFLSSLPLARPSTWAFLHDRACDMAGCGQYSHQLYDCVLASHTASYITEGVKTWDFPQVPPPRKFLTRPFLTQSSSRWQAISITARYVISSA
jgi:hypothetical protein